MYIALHIPSTRYSRPVLMKLEFSRQIFEKFSSIEKMKTLPVEAELFHADRRTDMRKLIIAFRNFTNAPKTTVCKVKRDIVIHSQLHIQERSSEAYTLRSRMRCHEYWRNEGNRILIFYSCSRPNGNGLSNSVLAAIHDLGLHIHDCWDRDKIMGQT